MLSSVRLRSEENMPTILPDDVLFVSENVFRVYVVFFKAVFLLPFCIADLLLFFVLRIEPTYFITELHLQPSLYFETSSP